MSVLIQRNELPTEVQDSVGEGILSAIGDRPGNWLVNITSDSESNAWDIEIQGPDEFQWARRFSASDRDADVISEAIGSAVSLTSQGLTDGLAALARQGIAFIADIKPGGETQYIVDRLRLSESEIIYLQKLGALTREGIRKYLVDRKAA